MTKNILVIRPERLGDLIIAMPVFRALRSRWPDRRIHVLTDSVNQAVLQGCDSVDEVISIDWKSRHRGARESLLSIIGRLRANKYEFALILYPGWSGWNFITALCGISRVVQLGGTIGALLLGHEIVRRKKYDVAAHYRDYFLAVAKQVGACLPEGDDGLPRLSYDEAVLRDFAVQFPLNPELKRIMVHPFGCDSAPNFSVDAYADIVQQLASDSNVEVWITGGVKDLRRWMKVGVTNVRTDWLGTLTINEMKMACMSSDVVLCGSTGIVHMAAALGVPTVGLYCPDPYANPAKWGALGPYAMNLAADPGQCRRQLSCDGKCCRKLGGCDLASGFSAGVVVDAVRQILHSGKRTFRNAGGPRPGNDFTAPH